MSSMLFHDLLSLCKNCICMQWHLSDLLTQLSAWKLCLMSQCSAVIFLVLCEPVFAGLPNDWGYNDPAQI